MGAIKGAGSIRRWATQGVAALALLAGGVLLLNGLKWIGHRRAQNLLSQYSQIGREGAPAPVLILSHAGPVDFSGPTYDGWQTVAMRSPLTSANTVRTGTWGTIDLALDRHVVLRIAPNSTVQFASMVRDLSNRIELVEIAMKTGQVISVIGNLKDGARFSIKTPTATVGVRGTVFMVESTPEGTIVSTLNGTVEVTTPADPGQPLDVVPGERLEVAARLSPTTGRREIMGRYTGVPPEIRKQMSQAVRENAFAKPRRQGALINAIDKKEGATARPPSSGRDRIARERPGSLRAEKGRRIQSPLRGGDDRYKKPEKQRSMQRLSDLRLQRPMPESPLRVTSPEKSKSTREEPAPPTTAGPPKAATRPSEPAAEEPAKEKEQSQEDEDTEDRPVQAGADTLSAEMAIRAILDECRDALEQLAAVPCLSRWTTPGFTLNVNGKVVPNLSRAAAELSRLITSPSVSMHVLTVTVREATAMAVFTIAVDARKAQTGDDVSRQFLVIMEFAGSDKEGWLAQSASAM
ncbi:MAG: FecR domain-containing protein [Nitrospirae bacterium]|nr:FecR domain-containing protein [Nitrospirota bacterium]